MGCLFTCFQNNITDEIYINEKYDDYEYNEMLELEDDYYDKNCNKLFESVYLKRFYSGD